MLKKKNVFFLFSLFLLITFNCQIPNNDDSDNDNDDNNDLPVKTIRWDDDGTGYLQFYTNDSQYLDYNFWTWNETITNNPMTTFEIELKKLSGYIYSGYGGIFCVQDTNNFYLILIDVDGWYTIYKKSSGSYNVIKDWTSTSNLNKNYNVLNTIKIVRTDATGGTFEVFFNNDSTYTFTESTFTGGMFGFFAIVDESESFPNTPLDARFKLLQPTL